MLLRLYEQLVISHNISNEEQLVITHYISDYEHLVDSHNIPNEEQLVVSRYISNYEQLVVSYVRLYKLVLLNLKITLSHTVNLDVRRARPASSIYVINLLLASSSVVVLSSNPESTQNICSRSATFTGIYK
jgi:hypothetical protein